MYVARQDTTSKLFLLQGYDVVLAHDAQAVVEAMKVSPHPDLVLLSYTLSGLTGSQVSLCSCCSLTDDTPVPSAVANAGSESDQAQPY